jgi:hypothetical protein
VLGLTGEIVGPLAKGEGVVVVAGEDGYSVEPLAQGQDLGGPGAIGQPERMNSPSGSSSMKWFASPER